MLAGTPVVGYPVTGLGEVVEHRRSGWIVGRTRPGALVDALLELRRDRGVRDRLSRRRESVARQYTRQDMIESTLHLYGSCCAERPATEQ